ncbi:WXG100 family type VII secretion target [Kitasatospora sp. NPDC059722]|uniref:WXG100 family type VII secretion target n=1 Tax=Kitasatospora sp. NPDC059722 TaxID=3346925 RepID=UPI00369232D0
MAYTDFGTYSHTQLRAMVHALNPGEVMAAGDPWRRAADTLKAIRTTLTRASTEAATTWEGTTSDAFHTRMLHLAERINHAAAYANDAANTLHHVADAIAKAKRDMPEEPGNWAQFKDAVTTFTDDDPTPLAARKKAEAATVMQTLAMHYRTATPMLKAPSPLGEPPKPGGRDDFTDMTAGDQVGVAAVAGLVGGVGGGQFGGAVARPEPGPASPGRGSGGGDGRARPQKAGASGAVAPVARVGEVPDRPRRVEGGAATGIDAARTSMVSGSNQPMTGPGVDPGPRKGGESDGLGSIGRGVPAPGAPGFFGKLQPLPERGGSAEASEGIHGGAPVAEGRRTGAGRTGGIVVGPGERPGGGPLGQAAPRGRGAFTEGGSGLGMRNRIIPEPAGGPEPTRSPFVPYGGANGAAKEKERGGRRPDYLVEDEETWASDPVVNPNVVK